MSDTVQAVKERIDVVDFIRGYVPLTPAGKNFKGLCPFHKEKTPSFMISPDRQAWHCFGCNTGGDTIAFLMKYENLEFFEALKILAERAGIDVRTVGGADQRQYAVLYEINQTAKEFFRANLKSETALALSARGYLKERGLNEATIDEFEIGFASNVSDALSRHLLKIGYKISDIEKAGLIFKTERGTYWDRFRDRIMFPLHNVFGKTVGFTGRIMPGASEAAEVGKYINSPETPIFNKSKLLFGFNKSKNYIRDVKAAVLIEGQMDLIMSWQDGIKNVIASSGTALTDEHLKALKRIADTLIVAYDNDEAGQAATERAIDLANAADFSVKVVDAPAGLKDPADLVKESPGALHGLIAAARPSIHHYFKRYIGVMPGGKVNVSAARDIINLKRNLRVVLAKIKGISSPVEQAHWVGELSALVNIPEQHLFDEMQALPPARASAQRHDEKKESVTDADRFTRRDIVSQRFVALALAVPELQAKAGGHLEFLDQPYRVVFQSLLKRDAAPLPAELNDLADLVALRSGFESGEHKAATAEFNEVLKNLKMEYYKEKREIIGAQIRAAEEKGDEQELSLALHEFDRISKEIYNI